VKNKSNGALGNGKAIVSHDMSIKEAAAKVAGALTSAGVEPGWAREIAANFTMMCVCREPGDEELAEVGRSMLEQRWSRPGAGRSATEHGLLPARERFAELGALMAQAVEGV
jgi:hypothetical protein